VPEVLQHALNVLHTLGTQQTLHAPRHQQRREVRQPKQTKQYHSSSRRRTRLATRGASVPTIARLC
jgi:hypothetical protein